MKTPTSPTEPAAAGFTLVETLAVLTLLSMAAAAFSFGGTRNLESAKFRALLFKTIDAIGDTRRAAIRSQTQTVFQVDPARGTLGGGSGMITLPAAVKLAADLSPGADGIRFYPQGTSSGGTLTYAFRGDVYKIHVNWLTGNASLDH